MNVINYIGFFTTLKINWRVSKADETLSRVTNGNWIYIYVYIYMVRETTLCHVKWVELSASHF